MEKELRTHQVGVCFQQVSSVTLPYLSATINLCLAAQKDLEKKTEEGTRNRNRRGLGLEEYGETSFLDPDAASSDSPTSH